MEPLRKEMIRVCAGILIIYCPGILALPHEWKVLDNFSIEKINFAIP